MVTMLSCLDQETHLKTARRQSCLEHWETYNRNSSDSNVAARWLSVVVTGWTGGTGRVVHAIDLLMLRILPLEIELRSADDVNR